MNKNNKNINNLPGKNASRASSQVKRAKVLEDSIMNSNVFSQIVLVESIDTETRMFRGMFYPHRLKNTLLDTSKNSMAIVDTALMKQNCLGFIPESIELSSITANKTLVLVVATDLDVIETLSMARKIKASSSNTGDRLISFRNSMSTYKANTGRSERSVIMVSKLLDF